MDQKQEWKHVAVLGAAGKMGSGIALLMLQEIALMKDAFLTLLDANVNGFLGLRMYLKDHLQRHAERHINALRIVYSTNNDLIDNEEIIDDFVDHALGRIRFVTAPEECRGASLIFEAVIEDVEIKAKLLSTVSQYADKNAYYFSNTSSIPIHVLQKKSGLANKLIGFHFYNPPAIQKLVELVIPANLNPRLKELAITIGKQLKKDLVVSNDIAGFIGNGHFIREIAEAGKCVQSLESSMSTTEGLSAVNQVTQEFLMRPMGIFQLIDYVGIEVCQHIAEIMSHYLGQSFVSPLISQMLSAGIKGGQNPDGTQKEGFFGYKNGHPLEVYDLHQKKYVPYHRSLSLGAFPDDSLSWKKLSKDGQCKDKIDAYFKHLWEQKSLGAKLARLFLENSQAIAEKLVQDGVAQSIHDVNTVLKHGFFHLYGVEEPLSKKELSHGRI